MKKLLLSICFVATITAFAQDKKEKIYRQRSLEVKEEIWGTKNAAFEVSTIPVQYKDESAVIIAKDLFYTQDKSSRLKLSLFGFDTKSRNSYITTIREKVKINDQAALEEYATLEYRKAIDKSTSYGLFSKNLNTAFTYIGAKVIKPDAKVLEQNMDEEVLTKDEKKKKEGKLAISNLQVGDILEYYIRIEEVQDDNDKVLGPFFFVAGGEHPVMDMNVTFIVDKRAGIATRAANGGKEFKQSTNEDKDFVFELHQTNLPKIESKMWQMPYRQLPYTVFSYKTLGGTDKPYLYGKVTNSVSQEYFFKTKIRTILELINQDYGLPQAIIEMQQNLVSMMEKTLDGKIEGRNEKEFNQDTMALTLFYVFQHYYGYSYNRFIGYYDEGESKLDCESNRYGLYSFYRLLALYKFMLKHNMPCDFMIVTPINSPKPDDIISYDDYDLLLRTKTKKPVYFTMDNRFNSPYELPVRYQGMPATIHSTDIEKKSHWKSSFSSKDTTITLPTTTATDNYTKDLLNVSFKPDAMNITEVDRTLAVSGHYRSTSQMDLCLPEETEKRNAQYLKVNDLLSQLGESRKNKDKLDRVKKLYDDARANWKDNFKADIKDQYGIEPKEVLSYDITNYALRYWEKFFEYKEKFTMEGWTKKAGNNYLFEAGKLIGVYTKVDDKERTRTTDIYMPCARTFDFNINVTIPEGYTAKGIENFNKNVTNESGMFTSTATLNGRIISIAVKRQFNNGFEPASKWKNLLNIMDACADFTTQKILFEKNR